MLMERALEFRRNLDRSRPPTKRFNYDGECYCHVIRINRCSRSSFPFPFLLFFFFFFRLSGEVEDRMTSFEAFPLGGKGF